MINFENVGNFPTLENFLWDLQHWIGGRGWKISVPLGEKRSFRRYTLKHKEPRNACQRFWYTERAYQNLLARITCQQNVTRTKDRRIVTTKDRAMHATYHVCLRNKWLFRRVIEHSLRNLGLFQFAHDTFTVNIEKHSERRQTPGNFVPYQMYSWING